MGSELTTPLHDAEPMLADTLARDIPIEKFLDKCAENQMEYAFEPKLDGMRALWHTDGNSFVLRSRTGKQLNARFKSAQLPDMNSPCVLDGELVAFDDIGQPSFNAIQRAYSRPGDPDVSYVVFDVLWHPEKGDVRKLPWEERRNLLEDLKYQHVVAGLVPIIYSYDGHAAWQTADRHGLEGLVAKRASSAYRAGRQGSWLKLKGTHTISCIVTGFEEGEGSRAATFGALELSVLAGLHTEQIGKVGSGFTEADLVHIAGQELPFVVDVSYQEWTGEALRFPVFKGLRSDIAPADCVKDQLSQGG